MDNKEKNKKDEFDQQNEDELDIEELLNQFEKYTNGDEEAKKAIEQYLENMKDLDKIKEQEFDLGKRAKIKIISNDNPNRISFKEKFFYFILELVLLFVFFVTTSILFKVFDENYLIYFLLYSLGYSLFAILFKGLIKKRLALIYMVFSIIIDILSSIIIFILSFLLIKQLLPDLMTTTLWYMLIIYAISISCWIFTYRYIKKKFEKKINKDAKYK